MTLGRLPEKHGLYDPKNEHDACGLGFVAHIKGEKSHQVVSQGLTILQRLEHRGAVGADPLAGDGAGLLMQVPHQFFTQACDFALPEAGQYAVGMVFLSKQQATQAEQISSLENTIKQEGLEIIGWRDVPVNNSGLGVTVKPTEPDIKQVFVRGAGLDQDQLERKCFIIHKQADALVKRGDHGHDFYICSMSSRTIVYKGMLLADQVGEYFIDLLDERVVSAVALVHQRFSTNTFPTWDLAHPFRMIAHNGEINTQRGNVNWMRAREHNTKSELLGEELAKCWPVIPDGQSDTACLDNALELMVIGGYSLAHAMSVLVPEAWTTNDSMSAALKNYYEYHAAVMEPWDGPAALAFTDGRQVGAMLDRNGLRPARYLQTKDDFVVMASEMGVLETPEENIIKKWRIEPGKIFLIDMEEGRIISDEDVKQNLASAKPYGELLQQSQLQVEDLQGIAYPADVNEDHLKNLQQAFGFTQESLKFIMQPMVDTAMEGTGSMGTDTPLAVLSNKAKHLSTYFKQNFAQVTNPPIDPIREEIVMSLLTLIGPRPNLLSLDGDIGQMRLQSDQPILSNRVLYRIRHVHDEHDAFNTVTLDICYPLAEGEAGMERAIERICAEAESAVNAHANIVVISDRNISADNVAIPSLLATSAVHQHLVRLGLRTETGLVVETGSAFEVHHFAALAGFGAEAINPWLAFETIDRQLRGDLDEKTAHQHYIKAIGKGLKKVFSKMGICTYQSYCGAQIFDAVGLNSEFIEKYFTNTSSLVEGVGVEEIAKETHIRHHQAYADQQLFKNELDAGGDYAYRIKGEDHAWSPESVSTLQHAVRGNDAKSWQEFSRIMNDNAERLLYLRAMMTFNTSIATPISIDEVEPAQAIVKRFATGAMSFGSISYEAHSTLAKAMNHIGGKSNTGEGGEESERFRPLADGSMNPERSAIKQIASGRFGVTTEYLVNADDLQIKMAQGAKPGEGGQLPGHKVNQNIASVRHSTPGVGLISPPPHHDIYSIEDLAQLIHDLKNVNPSSRISVKLVSEVGVGTVAAGVSKAHADHITISGYDGGTGASPLTSIKHAGSPWEIGLAETHQTLVLNRLRSRVCVQADGGLRTGRDVAIAALLGADEFGFATAPLIAEGCIMMRKCHLNTCPVGVATQDPELRKRFVGQPEHVINYFFFVAEELRQIMADLGFKTIDEMVGQMQYLQMDDAINHWKAKGLDFSRILTKPNADKPEDIYHTAQQDHGIDKALDNQLIIEAAPALEMGKAVSIDIAVQNHNRTFGTMLSGRVAERYGAQGLPDGTIQINAKGTIGQSMAAWLMKGVSIHLEGTGNDYVGKGLSGGIISIVPSANSAMANASENIIAGNTTFFGATSGQAYLNGVVGERCCVRNSGAHVVVEGIGDHGCEYMTGGVMINLGQSGRNFAAGMSGGIAYVYDPEGDFSSKCNTEMVTLDAVTADGASDFDDHLLADEFRLKTMIERHVERTQSQRGKDVLADWDAQLKHFVKVMPIDYKRALEDAKSGHAAA